MLTDNQNAPLVLIVEDDDNHVTLIKASLQDAPEEYRLAIAGTLCAARTAIDMQTPDLVLTDYQLPDGDGGELVLMAAGSWPVILMTSHGSEQVAVDAMKIGALDYIVKSAESFVNLPQTVGYALMTWSSIAAGKQAEAALLKSAANLRATLNATTDGILAVDSKGKILFSSRRFSELWNIPQIILDTGDDNALLGCVLEQLSDPHDFLMEVKRLYESDENSFDTIHFKDGRVFERYSIAVPHEDPLQLDRVWSFRDVTERKQLEEQVQQLAFYDTLTNLPNRRLLNDRLSQAMAASKRSCLYGALIFLDLDNFKQLNDTHGHVVGDLLLIEAANRLKSCVREMDTVARFGGDEFVTILSDLDVDKTESTSQAGIVAEKIRCALSEPYYLTIEHEGQAETPVEHHCTASIGVTLFIHHETNEKEILTRADDAMYQAKEAGHNLIRFL